MSKAEKISWSEILYWFLFASSIVAVFAVAILGCGQQPINKADPATNDIRYLSAHNIDPSHHAANLRTNIMAVPTPPGMAAQLITNVQKVPVEQDLPVSRQAEIDPLTVAIAPSPRIFTNSIEEYIPANGLNKTNRLWTQLQFSSNFNSGLWKTITSNEQISGSHATNNVTSTNPSLFFRTVSQSN